MELLQCKEPFLKMSAKYSRTAPNLFTRPQTIKEKAAVKWIFLVIYLQLFKITLLLPYITEKLHFTTALLRYG